MKLNQLFRSLNSRGAAAGASAVASVLVFILLFTFLRCRRYRRNQLPQARAQNRCLPLCMCKQPFTTSSFVCCNCCDSVPAIGRNNSSGKRSFHGATDEQARKRLENGSGIRELGSQPTNMEDDIVYDIKHPDPAEIGIAISYEDQDPGDTEDRLVYKSKPQPSPHKKGPGPANHSLVISPSRAYIPPASWQRLSRPPSSPSIRLAELSGEDDNDSDYQLRTFSRPADLPSKCYDRGPRAEEPDSYRVPVDPETHTRTPPNLGNDLVRTAASATNQPGGGPR